MINYKKGDFVRSLLADDNYTRIGKVISIEDKGFHYLVTSVVFNDLTIYKGWVHQFEKVSASDDALHTCQIKKYVGFTDSYNYCYICGKKE